MTLKHYTILIESCIITLLGFLKRCEADTKETFLEIHIMMYNDYRDREDNLLTA
ncbi:hypothetical protein [Flavobacterium sp. WC2509]|uniref:hypothetical protein n=1 Tax=Flavobacterium sp. WC2509 TaxID=3461406 RepID=UPI0040449EE2